VILVDTSVWIELLNGKLGARVSEEQLLNFATCGPVAQEVLQGLRSTPRAEEFREMFLSLPFLSNPLPLNLFVSASEIYRLGRAKGHTIRFSIDCLVAAIAIENRVPVWHRDRDYDTIGKFTPLRATHIG
jgi:predicted nucleic acid-binding protein